MVIPTPSRRTPGKLLAYNALLAVVYIAVARGGLMIGAVSGFATLVWPASGIALASIVRFGPGLAPGIAAGALLANLWNGAPPAVACGIAFGNTLEALAGAYALSVLGFRPSLERARDVAMLVLAALFSTLLSAALGVASLYAGGIVTFERISLTARAWWLGDVIGDLIVAWLLLIWSGARESQRLSQRRAEALALGLAALLVGLFVFHAIPPASTALRQAYLLFPLLIWAALRFEQRGASLVTFLASALAVSGTVRGFGPFAHPVLYQGLIQLQTFMAIVALTAMFLGAVIAERRQAQTALRRERNTLQAAEREAQRHAARVQLLADASRAYAEASRDLRGAMEEVARRIAHAIGDGCSIALLSLDGKTTEPPVFYHGNPEAHRLGAQLVAESYELQDTISGRVIASNEPLLIAEAVPETIASSFHARYSAYFARFPVHSVLAVPLRVRGQAIGSLAITRNAPGRPYTEHDRVLLEDLAERAALAIENARLLQSTRQALQLRDEFLSIASHELRTPLSALVLQLEGLQRMIGDVKAAPTVPKLAGRLEKLVRAADRLTKLVDSLLDVSRITSAHLDLHTESCDLSEIARETLERVGDQARSAGCELRLHAESGVLGCWDRLRLEQVLTNLLSNAIKYGSGKPIEVRVESTQDLAVLSVRDHGIGISQADADRIFRRFERAVPVRHYGGLGLGLYIARQIVEAHGGTIRVSSQISTGATFAIELPRLSTQQSQTSARIAGGAQ